MTVGRAVEAGGVLLKPQLEPVPRACCRVLLGGCEDPGFETSRRHYFCSKSPSSAFSLLLDHFVSKIFASPSRSRCLLLLWVLLSLPSFSLALRLGKLAGTSSFD